ncbi:MAG: hypothetical protein IPL96_06490 [Holophagaceae bacterium]|nr:hypothetical protein [Holophagaceae bacterium]
MNVMMSLAHNTSSSTLPYKLGPEDLGDFSLIGRYKIVRDVVFIRKNVMVHVSKDESDFDIVGLARWIDEHLTFVPRDAMTRQIPVPKGVSVRWPGSSRVAHVAVGPGASDLPVQAKVGEMLLIHLDPPGGADPKGFDLRQK